MRRLFYGLIFLTGMGLAGAWPAAPAAAYQCTPTAPDMLGPFYKPDAPLRSAVGRGYVLSGTVKSAADCTPIRTARIEFWMANPEGVYDDRHRATVRSDGTGAYRFESHFPSDYGFRPPHIHVKISAAGFKTLITQHYPAEGDSKARWDLVLEPR